MKKKLILLALLLTFFSNSAFASKLPDNFWGYIKNELPEASQRFDSVISLPNNVLYIPLYPAQKNDVEKVTMEYSYPKSSGLNSLPEVAIFNNNFVLLKVFKDKKGNFSVTTNENLPIKVRLGVMPQDMLVPVGLHVPESLKLVLGDLEIPQFSDNSISLEFEDSASKKQARAEINATLKGPVKQQNFVPLNELKTKKFFVSTNSSKFIYVYDGVSKDALYELKLSSLPSKILASNNSKFALVVYYANKTIEIVDLQAERVMEKIILGGIPKDAEIDQFNDLAYVTSAESNTIYVIDLKSGKLAKEIKLEQSPNKINVSQRGNLITFIDYKTNELFCLYLNEDYVSKFIAKTNNISKIIIDEDEESIYAISRTANKLYVYDIRTGDLIDEEKTDEKPVDAIKYGNKIYILCAKDGVMDIYDASAKKIIKVANLDKNGFYSKITKIPNQANAIITGVGTNKFLLFNLDELDVTRKQPFEVDVTNLIMIDK